MLEVMSKSIALHCRRVTKVDRHGDDVLATERAQITIAKSQLERYMKAAMGEFGNRPLRFEKPGDNPIDFRDIAMTFKGKTRRVMVGSTAASKGLMGVYVADGPIAQFIREAQSILADPKFIPERMEVYTLGPKGWPLLFE